MKGVFLSYAALSSAEFWVADTTADAQGISVHARTRRRRLPWLRIMPTATRRAHL